MTNNTHLEPAIQTKINRIVRVLLKTTHPNVVSKLNNTVRNKITVYMLLAVSLSIFSGCTDRVVLANDKMAEIRAEKAQQIEPPPEPELVEDYVYNAGNVRSPFMPPSLLNQKNKIFSESDVAPDLTRTKQPLESYELSTLTYRGMVVSPEGEQFGLIQRPDGIVDSVKVGDYMGTSDGRIVEITSTQINLIEIVSDNRGGFIEKPASVVSPI